jgi:hypothetical protein
LINGRLEDHALSSYHTGSIVETSRVATLDEIGLRKLNLGDLSPVGEISPAPGSGESDEAASWHRRRASNLNVGAAL